MGAGGWRKLSKGFRLEATPLGVKQVQGLTPLRVIRGLCPSVTGGKTN